MTLPNDHAPYDSDDDSYRDTWWFNATDISARRAIWVHCIWSERRQCGRHTLTIHDGDRSEKRIALTRTSPFVSDLLTLEVDPYKSMRLIAPDREVDVTWTAWHEPVNFSVPPFKHRVMSSMHLQASGRAEGTVLGAPFKGAGHRDRTSGPRDMTKGGRTVGVTLVGADAEVAFLSHIGMPATAQFNDVPSQESGGYNYIDGVVSPRAPNDTKFLRRPEGTLGAIRISGELFTVKDILAPVRWSPDGNLDDPTEAKQRIVFSNLYAIVIVESATYGRLTGGYGESMLMTY